MNSFILKIIAIVSMFCDHYGSGIIGHTTFLNMIGRLAFPIFAFQIAQGYIHTSDIKKYAFRLFVFSLISQAPFALFLSTFYDGFMLNVFFTMLLGILSIFCFDKIKNKYLGVLCVISITVVAELIKVDYGAYGVAIIFLFYIFSMLYNKKELPLKKKVLYKSLLVLVFVVITFLNYLDAFIQFPEYLNIYSMLMASTCFAIIPILFYNGKKGPSLKYLFYVFYPTHLLVLWAVHTYLLK